MTRRLRGTDIERAERMAGVTVSSRSDAAERVRLRFQQMREARADAVEHLAQIGEVVPVASLAETTSATQEWGDGHRARAVEAQRRLIGRANGELPYRAQDAKGRAREDESDLRIIESSKMLADVSRRFVVALTDA